MQEKIWSKTKVAGPLSAPDTLRHYSVCAFAWGMPGEIPGENFLRTAPANIAKTLTPHIASVTKTVQFPNSERQCCKYGGLIDRDIYQVGPWQ